MNVKLLRRIKKHILEEPKRLIMGDWLVKGEPGQFFTGDGNHAQKFANCGTAACIAGWACILTKQSVAPGQWLRDLGAQVLGIEPYGGLLEVSEWPQPFQHEYIDAKTPKKRARIAAERIDHFIATKGKD